MTTAAEDIWAILRELSESQTETDKKFKETDQKFKETDLKFKEMSQSIGKLGNRLGDFIEDALRPAVVRLFQERGIDVHEVHQNIRATRGDEGLEIDLLVVNSAEIVAVECKSNLSVDDINDHLERLAKLKRLLPSYADKQVLGAVAAMVIEDNVAQYAYRKGLFVIGQSGEHLEIRNAAGFVAKVW